MTRWLAFLTLMAPQDAPPPEAEAAKIEGAIVQATQFLKRGVSPPQGDANFFPNSDELILWALYHGGVPEDDPLFQKLLAAVLSAPLERTYKVAIQAAFLEDFNRVKYQWRIHQCAQFLVDNQMKCGSWSYGKPTTALKSVPVALPKSKPEDPKAAAALLPSQRPKPEVKKKLAVFQTRHLPDGWIYSNCNAFFAALGLRACHDAGIQLPPDVIHRAAQWWRNSQRAEEGDAKGGWCYVNKEDNYIFLCKGKTAEHAPFLSTTLGAVASLVIYDHMFRLDWRKDPNVTRGMEWLTRNFSMTENVGIDKHDRNAATKLNQHILQMVFSIERLGTLYGTERIGSHDWYAEGAQQILKTQSRDGSWELGGRSHPVWDTCWSILFLRRATRPLEEVKLVDGFRKK